MARYRAGQPAPRREGIPGPRARRRDRARRPAAALGSDSERARLNVTRAIRSAIARIRDRAPAAADYLDQAVRTGTRCSYSPPDRAGSADGQLTG